MEKQSKRTVWIVVYDSHEGHQIQAYSSKELAEAEVKAINDDIDLDKCGEWVSCEEVTVQDG